MPEIFPLSEKYIEDVSLLEKELFSDSWSEDAIKGFLSSPASRGYVLLKNGECVSYGLFTCLLGEGEVLRIGTKKSAARQGFAHSLLQFYFDDCKKEGLEKIFLEVRKENLAARRLYEKTGFSLIYTRKGYYKDPTDDACIYEKNQNGTKTL
ncbi:MAG: ribosomal protein S18-alanine N-acetyltransferase [Clostridia bacterium]|nr:ribosomal protein S18-alanine N-acetyltransferase [Clostridia bacterium]